MENVRLTAILALDECNGIGKDGGMPWHLKEDFAHFKQYTQGKVCVMGRATFEDIISYKKVLAGDVLPARTCIVLTKNPQLYQEQYDFQNVTYVSSPTALKRDITTGAYGPEVCIIGGASLFEMFAKEYTEVSATRISNDFECDTRVDLSNLLGDMKVGRWFNIHKELPYPVVVNIFEPNKKRSRKYIDDYDDLDYHALHSGKD